MFELWTLVVGVLVGLGWGGLIGWCVGQEVMARRADARSQGIVRSVSPESSVGPAPPLDPFRGRELDSKWFTTPPEGLGIAEELVEEQVPRYRG